MRSNQHFIRGWFSEQVLFSNSTVKTVRKIIFDRMFLQELCKYYMPHLLQNVKYGFSQRMMPADFGVFCLIFRVADFFFLKRGNR